MAISGFYVGLYVVFKGLSAAFSSPKKPEAGERHREERRTADRGAVAPLASKDRHLACEIARCVPENNALGVVDRHAGQFLCCNVTTTNIRLSCTVGNRIVEVLVPPNCPVF